jgi:4-amino-4-deoxy-L-arabinose transferase-like glycosyltransferase
MPSAADRFRRRRRALSERYGRTTLALLALILALGLGLRAYRVVEPLGTPGTDSHAYYALAKALYAEGSYGGPSFRDSSDWSPGAPLLYAAAFYATGGAREGTARIVEALLGVAAILVVFLLGTRINCRPAGLIAALGVAVYPPFIHSTGELMSEPVATFTLPAAVLAFLWASSAPPPRRQDTPARWLVPGVLFGLTALIRPEYLLVGIAFAAFAAIRAGRRRGGRSGLAAAAIFAAAFLLPIVPWTVRNAVVLGRLVPISTGGGKALYVGTYLPADGDYQRVKALLAERYLHRNLEPGSAALDRVDPRPLFDRVAARYPDLPRDSALGRIGKQDFSRYFGEDPLGYLAMTARKAGRIWSAGVGEAMGSTVGRIVQVLIALLGLGGLVVLAMRRRYWELVAMAAPIALVTAIGAVSLAAPRRGEILMTLVFPLAGAALARAGGSLRRGAAQRRNQRPTVRSDALA